MTRESWLRSWSPEPVDSAPSGLARSYRRLLPLLRPVSQPQSRSLETFQGSSEPLASHAPVLYPPSTAAATRNPPLGFVPVNLIRRILTLAASNSETHGGLVRPLVPNIRLSETLRVLRGKLRCWVKKNFPRRCSIIFIFHVWSFATATNPMAVRAKAKDFGAAANSHPRLGYLFDVRARNGVIVG